MSLIAQLRGNSLAIISLIVALTALGYNTWRNELSEENRTVREAGFAMLVHIGELQRVAYLNHYDNDLVAGNPRKGWTEVLVLKDLSELMPMPVRDATDAVADAWAENWNKLGEENQAIVPLDDSIDILRAEIKLALGKLE